MATHSSFLAWKIPWTEEPGGLQSMRLQLDTTEVTEHKENSHTWIISHWASSPSSKFDGNSSQSWSNSSPSPWSHPCLSSLSHRWSVTKSFLLYLQNRSHLKIYPQMITSSYHLHCITLSQLLSTLAWIIATAFWLGSDVILIPLQTNFTTMW